MTKEIHIDNEQIRAMMADIGRKITLDGWKPDYIVGLSRGGLIPAVMLSHYLNVTMYTLKVTLRDGQEDDCDHNCWMADDALGAQYDENDNYINTNAEQRRKKILIVDDINDSGATIQWIKNDWQSACLPDDINWETEIWGKNVRFATIINNLASKSDVDYYSMEINKEEDDSWIVFPWEEWWLR